MARPTPVHVEVAGRALWCLVCDADVFTVRTITLITRPGEHQQAGRRGPPARSAVTCTQFVAGGAGHPGRSRAEAPSGSARTHAPWAASRSPRSILNADSGRLRGGRRSVAPTGCTSTMDKSTFVPNLTFRPTMVEAPTRSTDVPPTRT